MPLVLVSPGHPCRRGVEILVGAAYRESHDAEVHHLPDRMLALLDDDGEPLAAVGLRTAADGFFSECYLDRPAEQTIAAATGQPVRRDAIVELTALASLDSRALLQLLRGMVLLAGAAGQRWLLFTAIRRLRDGIARTGLVLHDLGAAERRRVPDPENWGSYYRSAPRVAALALADVTDRLSGAGRLRRQARPELRA